MAADSLPIVLCVDDEPPILSALARLLRREPVQVITTGDPDEALDHIRSKTVRLVVCDYRMRVLSGTSLLQLVKALSPSTVRILLTGYPEDGPIRSAEERGLLRLCTKPWDDDELRRIIREAVGV